MTLQAKLVGGFLVTAGITLAVAAVGYWQAERLASALYEVGVVRLPSVQGLNEISEAMATAQTVERSLLTGLDEATLGTERRRLASALAQIERGVARYEPLPQTPDESIAWRAFVPLLQVWRAEHDRVMSLIDDARRTGDPATLDRARAASFGTAAARFDEAQARLVTVQAINYTVAAEERAQSVDDLQSRTAVERFMLLSAAAGVLSAVLLGLIVGRHFSRPVVEVAQALSAIADGDLSKRIDVRSGDDIGTMSAAVNHLAGALQSAELSRHESTSRALALHTRYDRQRSALATLMRLSVSRPEHLVSTLQEITEVVAHALEGDRVSIWRFTEQGSLLLCDDMFERGTSRHSSGATLARAEFPELFRDISDASVFEVTAPEADPRTSAFNVGYLASTGVRSYMRAQIRAQGVQIGALACAALESRAWHTDEQTFLTAAANLVAALIAQAEGQRLEAQLRQAQKMEAFGQLAGGVAHDFNNILTVILGRAYQLSEDEGLSNELHEAATDILHSAERAGNLTRQLLAFSRRQAMQITDVDLNTVVADMARMLQRILGEDIESDIRLAPGPVHIRADAGMLDQILLNLAVNARDAMPSGGRLSIETGVDHGFARLQVSDTGCGIAPEHMTRIFEPFFTTKDPGKGTGLGLATTYSIVQQHGGRIDVTSALAEGTTFTIRFPHVPSAQPMATPPTTRPSTRGTETILVVEDEDAVRSLVVQGLLDLGYRVVEASSGPTALTAWETTKDVDLVVTDMVMPDGLTGTELVRRLRSTRPALKVIYVSGYFNTSPEPDELTEYLPKPFRIAEMARVVHRLLSARIPVG